MGYCIQALHVEVTKKNMDENLFSQSRLFSLAMGSVLDFGSADRIRTTFFRSKISDFFWVAKEIIGTVT